VSAITALVASGEVDLVLHVGDISYADGASYRWDDFLVKIAAITSMVPYMVVPGNHELWFDFAAVAARWTMPRPWNNSNSDSLYYTFNVGGVSFVMLNTETAIDTRRVGDDRTC